MLLVTMLLLCFTGSTVIYPRFPGNAKLQVTQHDNVFLVLFFVTLLGPINYQLVNACFLFTSYLDSLPMLDLTVCTVHCDLIRLSHISHTISNML